MVVWLYVSEVSTITLGETIVSVKLEDSFGDRTGGLLCIIKTCSEVEIIVSAFGSISNLCPYQFFNGVVKGEAGFWVYSRDSFSLVLKLVNEVFVAHLGETTTFFSIEVDVINVESGAGDGVCDGGPGTRNIAT